MTKNAAGVKAQVAITGQIPRVLGASIEVQEAVSLDRQIGANARVLQGTLPQIEAAVGDLGPATQLLEKPLAVGQGVELLGFPGSFTKDHGRRLESGGVGIGQVVRKHIHPVLGAGDAVCAEVETVVHEDSPDISLELTRARCRAVAWAARRWISRSSFWVLTRSVVVC